MYDFKSVWATIAAHAANGFACDTAFGIEGSILASILLAAGCVAIILIDRMRRAKQHKA